MTSLVNIGDYNSSTSTVNQTVNIRNIDADSVAAVTLSGDTIVWAGEDLAITFANLDNDVLGLDTRLTTAEGDIDALDTRLTTAEGDIGALDTRLTTAEGDIDALDTRLTTAEGDIDALDTRLTTAEGDITTLNSKTQNISATNTTTTFANDIVQTTGTTSLTTGITVTNTLTHPTLDFKGTASQYGLLQFLDNNSDAKATLYASSGSDALNLDFGSLTNGLRIRSSGVDVLTVAPSGQITNTDFQALETATQNITATPANTVVTGQMIVGGNISKTGSGASSVAIGPQASVTNQGTNAVSIGDFAGAVNQGGSAIAIGYGCGQFDQLANGISIGPFAGQIGQSFNATAIGLLAGNTSQQQDSIAIGSSAGKTSQGNSTIAIGRRAGETNQGADAVAIGSVAGTTTSHARSLILNASAAELNSTGTDRCHIAPIRGVALGIGSGVMSYDTVNKEVVYSTTNPAFRSPISVQYDIGGLKFYDLTIPNPLEIKQVDIDWYNAGLTFTGTLTPAANLELYVASVAGTPLLTGYNCSLHTLDNSISSVNYTTKFACGITSVTAAGTWFGRSSITYISQAVVHFQSNIYNRIGTASVIANGWTNGNGNPLHYIRLGVQDNAQAPTFTTGTNAVITYRYN